MDASASQVARGFASASTRATARRLRLGRQHLGGYRHDLLVAIRVVNKLEREMVSAEWSNWLHEETIRCGQAQAKGLLMGGSEGEDEGAEEGMRWLMEYCGSCDMERRAERLLSLD